MLTVTQAAMDRTLLTMPEMRDAVGVANNASDGELQPLGDRIAAVIAQHCKVAGDGVNPPTLREETISEVFRLERRFRNLPLSRRHVTGVVSVVHNGATLTAEDYELNAGAGLLGRLINDWPSSWTEGKVTVTYKAGFSTVPADLKMAATKLARMYWSEKDRNPLVKSETIPDVLTTSYWVGSLGDGALPPDIADLLAPYRNMEI